MRVIFAGTPEFACTALRRLFESGFELALVLTRPDRPAGRGMKLQPTPVQAFAQAHGLPVAQPRSLRLDGPFAADAAAARDAIASARADVMVVAAYGLLLPQWVLGAMRQPRDEAMTPMGCLNIHASLLPRWRGAAPIHRAIEAGDAGTGITIMQMDAGLDTGDIVLAEPMPIAQLGPGADTTGSLQEKLAELGADMIVRVLERVAAGGRLSATPQSAQGVCYARKVEKSDAEVDWVLDAASIERRIRAFNPAPTAWTRLGGQPLKLWAAELDAQAGSEGAAAGTVLYANQDGIGVACGQGALRLRELQRAGGKRLGVAEFLRGFELQAGMRFGRPSAP